MDFRKIEYFLAAAETLNFSVAAKKMFISPQALTQQISQLEDYLGKPLFLRTTRKVALTEFGEFCYSAFKPVKNEYDAAVKTVIEHASAQKPRIRIAFYYALPKHDIAYPWIDKIVGYSDEIAVEVSSADLYTLEQQLNENTIDLCLTIFDSGTAYDAIKTKTIFTTPAKVVVSENHPLAGETQLTLDMLADVPMLQMRRDGVHPQGFYDFVPCSEIVRVPDFDTMLAMLENGKFFAIFPPTFMLKDISRLKYLDLPSEMDFSFSIVCAYSENNTNPLTRRIFDYLYSE